MRLKFLLIGLFITIALTDPASGQENPSKTDSTGLYENIGALSEHYKVTRLLYSMIFKPPVLVNIKNKGKKKNYKGLTIKPYSDFEGKIIRSITIETLDPFGYSLKDTLVKPHTLLTRAENSLHIKTRELTIRNLLLFRKNQPFDSLLVKESERLIRQRDYVVECSFLIRESSKNSDSVDIFIRSLDRWSIIPGGAFSSSDISLDLADNNFMGLGHTFKNGGTLYKNSDEYAFHTNYYVPNIKNTFITTRLSYARDKFGNFNKKVSIDRPFFSPYAKWAAGMLLANEYRRDSLFSIDSVFDQQRFNYKTQDYWAGNAIQIFKGHSEKDRTTNFISTVRFLRIRYLERPDEFHDAQYKYSGEDFYFGSIGISTRKYVQDKYIFKYGLTEDVPIGKAISLTGGYQDKNDIGRFYLKAKVLSGNYHHWGYLSSNFEYGTFFHEGRTEQGTVAAGINYYTGLHELGNWKFRQFLKTQVTIGINRFSNDSLNLNEGHGLIGFKSEELWGSGRIMFTMQIQSYAPWDIIGFRLGPYINCSLGMLGNEDYGFKNSDVYSQIGLGVLIKNENLIINTFQVSISFYPNLPGDGQNMFKINSIRTNDFGFRDFEIGKPGTVIYQ